jgi:cardiolipin synthase (CMP-forming)
MKRTEIPLNIPNILSLYRLFSFPFVMIFIFLGHEALFVFFMWFNLTTDILDGWIARRYNQVTEIGAKIDGLADSGTYILAFTGLIVFKWPYLQPHSLSFFMFLVVFIISRLFSLFKFGRFFGFHTYGVKIAGYIHGSFFIALFLIDFYKWFYFLMIISGIVVYIENILITIALKEPRTNIKGIYWILKESKKHLKV